MNLPRLLILASMTSLACAPATRQLRLDVSPAPPPASDGPAPELVRVLDHDPLERLPDLTRKMEASRQREASHPEGAGFFLERRAELAPPDSYELGRRKALDDIAQGRLELHTFGYPSLCREDFAELLLARHNVRLVAVAGCVVNKLLLERIKGHNDVVEAEIEARFGVGAVERAAHDAGCF